MPTADRTRSRNLDGSNRPLPANHALGSRPYALGTTTPTTGLSTRTDPSIFLGSSLAGPSSAPAARRPLTLASSEASTRRTSASSVSSVSTAASSVSAGPPPTVSAAEKNRQKQQRYRDRIKDTIASLQSDNTRLTKENLELRQRIARVELRNAALEHDERDDSGPLGWADSDGGSDGHVDDDDAHSWVSSFLDEDDDDEVMTSDRPDNESTPLGRPEAHPANEMYSSFTPPVSTNACPPTPQVERIPTFAPDVKVSPPSVLGLVASQTAQGHCLFRTAPPKHVLSGAPSPLFPSVQSLASGQPAVLGTTPSNVLGLQLESLSCSHPVDNPFNDGPAERVLPGDDEVMNDDAAAIEGVAPVSWTFEH